LLLFACGPKTCILYSALSLGIIISAYGMQRIQNDKFYKIVFVVSVAVQVLVIVVYLKFRIYFQKYFVYLPSLSYLGFRGIAYLTSVYRNRRINLSVGLLQMLFFPMLFIGPISRAENFEEGKYNYASVLQRLMLGLAMLIAGRFCSVYVLANLNMDSLKDIHWSLFWLGAVSNSFEIYFTFAGYSHLVIGLGLLAGFQLPENFNNPYFATSISEFWRRWHMSLSYWIRDYLYIPLGGSRRGVARKCFNLIVPMGICGAWHGLSWHYVLWGLYHGVLLAIESLMAHFGLQPVRRFLPAFAKPVKVAITFCLTTFGWLLFTYPLSEFIIYMKGLVSW